jgi:hypothetical protein
MTAVDLLRAFSPEQARNWNEYRRLGADFVDTLSEDQRPLINSTHMLLPTLSKQQRKKWRDYRNIRAALIVKRLPVDQLYTFMRIEHNWYRELTNAEARR